MLPSDVIQTYGAFAGIAAIVGLAVLSLLLFTQAREIKRLREWVGRAPERDAELATRVRTEAGRAPGPVQRGSAGPTTAAAAAAAAAQARPAAGQPGNHGGRAPEPGAAPAAAPAMAAAPGSAPPSQQPQASPGQPGGGQPQARPDGSPPPPGPPPSLPGQAQQGRPATAASPSAAAPPKGRRPGGQPPPPSTGATGRRFPPLAGVAVGAGVLLVLAVGVLVLTGTFSGGDQPPPRAAQPSNDVARQGGGAAEQPRPRGEVTVAVLNGTTSAGLAAGTAAEVAQAGFRPGAVDDNDVQNLSATTIEYAQGYRPSAQEVAEVVGVGADAIARLDRNTQVLAGEQANVVIIVGADGTQAAEGTG